MLNKATGKHYIRLALSYKCQSENEHILVCTFGWVTFERFYDADDPSRLPDNFFEEL